MFEFDFLPVGDGDRSGDAICVRYTHPQTGSYVHGVIDAGFEDDGDKVIEHVKSYYGTGSVEFVLSTHPDCDHIGGMGKVLRGLDVVNLLIHRPAQHGHPANSGARPAEELVALAHAQGTKVVEPFRGVEGFGGTLVVAGPIKAYYEQMLNEQAQTTKATTAAQSRARRTYGILAEAAQRALAAFPVELPFDDAGGTNPRNNSAAIASFLIDGHHFLLPSDAGVPAITQALDYLDAQRRTATWPRLFVLPHHGSRHNIDRDTIHRILGAHTSASRGSAVASVSAESSNPSPRVANAAGRRGYPVYTTAGQQLWHHSHDAPPRPWGAATPLPPLPEDDHD
jgi:beta-lactamase superfamily II metal-dependent hydrolase